METKNLSITIEKSPPLLWLKHLAYLYNQHSKHIESSCCRWEQNYNISTLLYFQHATHNGFWNFQDIKGRGILLTDKRSCIPGCERQGWLRSRTKEATFCKLTTPAFPQVHFFPSPPQSISNQTESSARTQPQKHQIKKNLQQDSKLSTYEYSQ